MFDFIFLILSIIFSTITSNHTFSIKLHRLMFSKAYITYVVAFRFTESSRDPRSARAGTRRSHSPPSSPYGWLHS